MTEEITCYEDVPPHPRLRGLLEPHRHRLANRMRDKDGAERWWWECHGWDEPIPLTGDEADEVARSDFPVVWDIESRREVVLCVDREDARRRIMAHIAETGVEEAEDMAWAILDPEEAAAMGAGGAP